MEFILKQILDGSSENGTPFASLPEHQRRARLSSLAYSQTDGKYMKPLDSEEIEERKQSYIDNDLRINELLDEKKEVVKRFKDEIDVHVTQKNRLLEAIKTKQEPLEGTVYLVPDFDNRKMLSIDLNGNVIETRSLKKNEYQQRLDTKLIEFPKEGTNG